MLTIDFETKDPYIALGYGPGWPFALRNYKNPEFKLLGTSLKEDDAQVQYLTDFSSIARIINSHNELIMHNCMYDIGCIFVLFQQLGVEWTNYKNTTFHDTMLMSKIINQQQFSYSLENCSKLYGGIEKSKSTLTDYVWNTGLFSSWYKDIHNINKRKRPSEDQLFSYAISNLDIIPEEIVAEYCNFDVEATHDLHEILIKKLSNREKNEVLTLLSDNIKACVEIKKRGVRIAIDKADEVSNYLKQRIKKLTAEVYLEVGNEFNFYSSEQLGQALRSVGISDIPKTKLGNDSIVKGWLDDRPEEVCQKINKIKNYTKLCNDFIVKLIQYQNIHRQNNSNENRVFPNFNILGATATGRMSSSGYRKDSLELNFQQIPKRGDDKEAAKYVRQLFIPEENETWISADYSNQEQRLQVEYAHRLKLNGVSELVKKLIEDPFIDFHKTVADICKIERTEAKSINLGLSYSMGEAKLCRSLGLPTKWVQTKYGVREVAGDKAKEILNNYHNFLPFMKELQKISSDCLQNDGFVTTIDGRRLYLDPPIFKNGYKQTFEYKGLSKLIQGSAAGVTMKAVSNCYKSGLNLLLIVHDEINISSKNLNIDKETLKVNMENTFENVTIPMVVEISEGAYNY